jgi:hypothetical protein
MSAVGAGGRFLLRTSPLKRLYAARHYTYRAVEQSEPAGSQTKELPFYRQTY